MFCNVFQGDTHSHSWYETYFVHSKKSNLTQMSHISDLIKFIFYGWGKKSNESL